MRILLFFVMLICSSAFISCTNASTEKKELPTVQPNTTEYTTISFKDTLINFGTINMGEESKIVFEFTNTGNHPLFLTEVKPGCGCTVAAYTKEAIAPGAKGSIIAAFDSKKAHPGSVTKNIYVTSNTSNGLLHTLTFSGEIKEVESNNK